MFVPKRFKMPARSIITIPTYIFIPPIYDALYKIEIVGSDGTAYDITDIILEGEIVDGATDTIGNFNFTIDNSSQTYQNKFSGNEVLNFYCDYAKTAATKRFRGRTEKVNYTENTIKLTGRGESLKLLKLSVTKSSSDIETSVILTELFQAYTSGFTYNNINVSSANVTINWYQKPMMECIQELCKMSGFDFYIDADLDVHYFESGSITNSTEGAVHTQNIFETGEFAYDQSQIANRVIVYGANIGDLPLIKTAEDLTSQTIYGIRELIINDSNITTETQAQERADYELALAKDPPLVGDITCKGLATLQPGEKIWISDPDNNLQPNTYKIVSYRHKFEDFHETILTIEKEPQKIYHIIRDRISTEQKITEMPNPYEMKYSWNFDFNTDSGTHSTTQIINGVLKSTASSGTWISSVKSLSSNATACELRAIGETISGTNFYVSSDNGVTWQTISLNTSLTLSPPGQNLKIKIILNSADTQIDSLCLLHKK